MSSRPPTFPIEPLAQPGRLTDRVTEALTQMIRAQEYPPRTRLPTQTQLAARFGVSLTVIREAVSRLQSEGLVEVRQGSGAFVREASLDKPFRFDPREIDSLQSVLRVVEVRKGLEAEMAALAAVRGDAAAVLRIRAAHQRMIDDVAQGKSGVDADIAFHRSIALATENPYFLDLLDLIGQFLRSAVSVTRAYESRHQTLTGEVLEEHGHIVVAIERHDADAARQASMHHMDGVVQRITSADPSFWGAQGTPAA